MVPGVTPARATRSCERVELFGALDRLGARDQRILGRLVRRLAVIERAQGEAAALAVVERMEMTLRGAPTL